MDFTWFVGQGLYLLQMLVAQERLCAADNGNFTEYQKRNTLTGIAYG
jgi:hypothetical protein